MYYHILSTYNQNLSLNPSSLHPRPRPHPRPTSSRFSIPRKKTPPPLINQSKLNQSRSHPLSQTSPPTYLPSLFLHDLHSLFPPPFPSKSISLQLPSPDRPTASCKFLSIQRFLLNPTRQDSTTTTKKKEEEERRRKNEKEKEKKDEFMKVEVESFCEC